MGWSDILDGAIDKVSGFGKSSASVLTAPLGAALDLTRWATGNDLDNGIFGELGIKKSAANAADLLMGEGTLTGWAIGGALEGLDTAYRYGVENPIEAGLYKADAFAHGDALSWGDAYDVAKRRNLGQTAQLINTDFLRGLNEDFDKDGKLAGRPYDEQAWEKLQKLSPFWTGIAATGIDVTAQFAGDPTLLALKATEGARAARKGKKAFKNLDDLFGTVKYTDHPQTYVDDYGNTVEKAIEDSVTDDYGNVIPLRRAEADKPGWIDGKSAAEIYYGLRLDRNPEQGHTMAALLAHTNTEKNAAERLNIRRELTLAVNGGDLDALTRLRQAGHDYYADTLENAFRGRQSAVTDAAIRDAENPTKVSTFNSPDVVADVDRQLLDDKQYQEGLRAAMMDNPLRVSAKGERAIARLHNQGIGRDGTLHTGLTSLDNIVNKVASGKFKSNGSPLDEALAKSDDLKRPESTVGRDPRVPDHQTFFRGAFATPATVLRAGVKAAGWATITPYMKAGYGLSNGLRGKVVHGALNLEDGNEALVTEFVRDRLRRAGVESDEADRLLSQVVESKNPTDRYLNVRNAENAAIKALGKKYGIGESGVRALLIGHNKNADELGTAISGQARYSSGTRTIGIADEPGEFMEIPADVPLHHSGIDVTTLVDEEGAIQIQVPTRADAETLLNAEGHPVLSTQTPNQIYLPDIDFVRTRLKRDAGLLGAVAKLRDNVHASTALREEAARLGLRSTQPLRARDAADNLLHRVADEANNNWKRAALLFRPGGFAIRNTLEEEMRVWSTGHIAVNTQIALEHTAHRLREYMRTRSKPGSLGAKWFDAERHAILQSKQMELEDVLATHNDERLVADVKTLRGKLSYAKGQASRAIREHDLDAYADWKAEADFLSAHPALLEHEARTAEIKDMQSQIAAIEEAMRTPVGIGEGTRTVQGVEVPKAYEGVEGRAMRDLVAGGSAFDAEVTGAASRAKARLAGPGEPSILRPRVGDSEGVEQRHLAAWKHVLNYQIAQAPEARVALEARSLEATRDEMAAVVREFLASDKAAGIRAAAHVRSKDLDGWAHDIADLVEQQVPSASLAESLLKGEVSAAELRALIPEPQFRPDVHLAGVSALIGHQAKKLDAAAGRAFRRLDKMSLQAFTRHPYYTAMFNEEQERLVAKYLERAKRDYGDDAGLSIDEINELTHRARTVAAKKVKETFYDTTSRSYAAHKLRYIYPFFASHQNSLTFWGHAVASDPAVLRKLQLAYEQPINAGLVVDYEGNPVDTKDILSGDAYILMQMPHAWGGPDLKDPKARRARFSISQRSLNLILQNGSIVNPGAGPLAAVPAGYIQKHYGAKDEDISKAMTWFNPFGAPVGQTFGESAFGTIAPTPLKRAKEAYDAFVGNHSREYMQMYKIYSDEAQAKFYEENGRYPTKVEARRLMQDVADKVKSASVLKFFTSVASPSQPRTQSKMQGLIDEYKRLEDQGRKEGRGFQWASDKFLDAYGDAYIALTRSASEYRAAGVPPSQAAYRELDANKKLVQQLAPETWQAVIGAAGEGAFSTDAYRAMQAFKVSAGSDKTMIDKRSPEDVTNDVAVAAGYREYNKILDSLRATATAHGFTSIDESPDLKAIRIGAVHELEAKNPQWAASRRQPGKDFEGDIIPSLTKIVSTKSIANDPARTDVRLLAGYLEVRAAVKQALQMRAEAGGPSTIDADANADLAALFAKYIAQAEESNTLFANYMMPNLIERDPFYKPELLEVK